jgi:hypothetical protein
MLFLFSFLFCFFVFLFFFSSSGWLSLFEYLHHLFDVNLLCIIT